MPEYVGQNFEAELLLSGIITKSDELSLDEPTLSYVANPANQNVILYPGLKGNYDNSQLDEFLADVIDDDLFKCLFDFSVDEWPAEVIKQGSELAVWLEAM